MPIVDQYTYLGVEISKNCSWDAHINKLIQKGKTEVGRMDMILRDSRLDTRIKRCILLNVIVPKLEYSGELGGKQEVGGEVGNSADVSCKGDTRVFENNEQYSIESRVGNVRFQNKQRHEKTAVSYTHLTLPTIYSV